MGGIDFENLGQTTYIWIRCDLYSRGISWWKFEFEISRSLTRIVRTIWGHCVDLVDTKRLHSQFPELRGLIGRERLSKSTSSL